MNYSGISSSKIPLKYVDVERRSQKEAWLSSAAIGQSICPPVAGFRRTPHPLLLTTSLLYL